MRNLVYKDGMLPSTKKVFDALKKESNVRFEEMWKEHILYGNMGFRVDNRKPEFGLSIIGSAVRDGVTPELAADHAKDMGYQRSIDVDRSLPPLEAFIKPMEIGTLNINWNRRTQIWHFRDDRGVEISISENAMRQLPDTGFMVMDKLRRYWLKIVPSSNDKLRRYFHVEDDRGCSYPYNVMYPTPVIHSQVPIRGVLTANWRIQDPNKQQGGAEMAQVKEATEKPIQQQPVKLGVYFRVNGMPQELTQKQANEHVAKLLTLGASEVSVQRYIRDETSSRYTNQTDYR